MSDLPAPNWYTDPDNSAQVRWWDGTTWSDRTQPHPNLGSVSPEPGPAVETASPAPASAITTAPQPAGVAVAAAPEPAAAPQAQPAGSASASAPAPGSPAVGNHSWQSAPWSPPAVPVASLAAPAATNGASAQGEPSAGRRNVLQARILGLPVWLWSAVVVVAIVLLIVVIPSEGGGSTSGSPAINAATCPNVIRVLDQRLAGTSLATITNQVIASPTSAASPLQQYAAGFRQGAEQASADPQLHQELNNVANDAGFAGVTASTGFGNLGSDLVKLGQDVGMVDTTCGATPPFAR